MTRLLIQNPHVAGVAVVSSATLMKAAQLTRRQFASPGGFLFGYDQGVVSSVINMGSPGLTFLIIYTDEDYKGWFVSTSLLAAWFGTLINGPIGLDVRCPSSHLWSFS